MASGAAASHVRFAFFDCAVVVAAIYAGMTGGLFVTIVGILVVGYEWMPPHGTMALRDSAAVFAICGFAIGSLIVTTLAASFRWKARQLTAARDAAMAKEERQRLLDESGRVLASSLDYERTISAVAELAVPRFADWCTVDLVVDGHIERLAVAHPDPEKLRVLRDVDIGLRPGTVDESGIAAVIRSGEPQFFPIVTGAMIEAVARDAEQLAKLRALHIRSAMIVPMTTRGTIIGALTLISSRDDHMFSDADFMVAQSLGRRAASAIDRARLYRAARTANEAKTNFIATMSHELRTPLTAILGFQELLADGVSGPVSEGQKQPLQRIKTSALRLQSLIEEILLFARLDAGTEKAARVERVRAKNVVDDVIAFASGAAEESGLTLRAEPIDDALDVETDVAKLRQILVTLVSNALKFTIKGEVVLRASEENGSVAFEVRDTGIGIDRDGLVHLFDPFWQAEQTTTRRSGGSGLGLTVARRLAQLLGGDIVVQSTPSVGSTFRVVLPRSSPPLA